jgi:two-component system, NtrC family, response regulator HydG
MPKVLFVEDDPVFAKVVTPFLERKGYEVVACSGVREAEKIVARQQFDILLLDYRLPDGTGLDVMKAVRRERGPVPAVIMTSLDDIRTAVKAMRAGAFDYITKPVNHEELLMIVEEALQTRPQGASNGPDLSNAPPGRLKRDRREHIEGSSPAARELYRMAGLVAPTDMSVLIQGESGTGKEHIARSIHAKSNRAEGPFVAIDCGVQSNELAVSELFGHVKGAFTGAAGDKKGKFEIAGGGTLFLDEVGNLNYEVQAKLLRALQERIITPLGGNKEIKTDVRIIAATNETLWERVQKGLFREDLYHRLNEFSLTAPALRDLPEDLAGFVAFFIRQANRDLHKSVTGLTEETRELLESYDWPGNLRELRNVIRRSVLLTGQGLIGKEVLPLDLAMQLYRIPSDDDTLNTQRQNKEREVIIETLRACRFNKTKAAEKLNIDRKTLYNKMRRYGISL